MKSMKKYLITMFVLLCIAIIAGIVVWYLYQVQSARLVELEQREAERIDASLGTTSKKSTDPVVIESEPVTLTTDSLSPGQKAVLESFGMGDATITVTDATIACAKEAVGDVRYKEILAGSAPSPLEALKLLPCVKK
jgi:hypothetical protein